MVQTWSTLALGIFPWITENRSDPNTSRGLRTDLGPTLQVDWEQIWAQHLKFERCLWEKFLSVLELLGWWISSIYFKTSQKS